MRPAVVVVAVVSAERLGVETVVRAAAVLVFPLTAVLERLVKVLMVAMATRR